MGGRSGVGWGWAAGQRSEISEAWQKVQIRVAKSSSSGQQKSPGNLVEVTENLAKTVAQNFQSRNSA